MENEDGNGIILGTKNYPFSLRLTPCLLKVPYLPRDEKCWQVGRGAVVHPVKIFKGRQKLEKGAKNCITNDARTPFVGRNSEFGKTKELFNSLGHLCFAEGRVAKTARAL